MTSSVVCIGGGVAVGSTVKSLAKMKGLTVTVITPHDYLEWPPGAMRSLIKPDEATKSLYPVARAFGPAVKIVKGYATKVEGGAVSVRTIEGATLAVPYEYLLIATGGKYDAASTAFLKNPANGPSMAARVEQFEAKHRELAQAASVLVVGTGAMGTELAAEIKHAHPAKDVTLAGRGSTLLPGFSKKSSNGAAAHMRKVGVKVELGVDVTADKEKQYDLVYHCTGFSPTTAFLKDGDLKSALDPRGFVRTGADGLVSGQRNVFAMGDIVTPGYMEAPFVSAYVAGAFGPKMAANIASAAKGKGLKSLGKPPMRTGGVVALGPTAGVGNFDGFNVPGCMVVMLKSKDVFRAKYAKKFS